MLRIFTSTLITALAMGHASAAFAADGNSYRAGQVYLKTAAPAAGACALQCEGDAQCKSWNYLQLPRTSSGVCEFNATFAPAQPHPFALSGVNAAAGYNSANVIPGATRTMRIGQPVTVRARSEVAPKAAPRPKIDPRTIRGVARTAIPAQQPAQTRQRRFAPQGQPAAQPQQRLIQRPAARPAQSSVQSLAQNAMQMPASRPAPYPYPIAPSAAEIAQQNAARLNAQRANQPPAHQPSAHTQSAHDAAMAARMAVQNRAMSQMQNGAQTTPASAPMPRFAQPQTRQRQIPAAAPTGYPAPIRDFETAVQSRLYGGLYDDVAAKPKAPTPPLYSEQPASSLDAPIATSPFAQETRARPTTPVDIMPLAGAAPQ